MVYTPRIWIDVKEDGDNFDANEENQYVDEIQNSILGAGLKPSKDDTNQLTKSISNFVKNGSCFIETETSTSNAYIVKNAYDMSIVSGFRDGMCIYLYIINTNTGASTITVSSIGTKDIKKEDGSNLTIGDLSKGDTVELMYNESKNRFELIPREEEVSGLTMSFLCPTMNKERAEGWCFVSETIGSSKSQADYKSDDAYRSFMYLWNTWDQQHCEVIGGRGANAIDDWNNGKAIRVYNDTIRRALSTGYSQGDYWTGKKFGEDEVTLNINNITTHNHDISGAKIQLRTQASSGQPVVLEAGAGYGNAGTGDGNKVAGHFKDHAIWRFIRARFNSNDSCRSQPIRKVQPIFYPLWLFKLY